MSEPISTPPSAPQPPHVSPNKSAVPLAIILTALIVGAGMYYWLKKSTPYTPDKAESIEQASDTISSKGQGEIVSLDENWNAYTNKTLGISFKFPKQYGHSYGSCVWNKSEKSYRPEMALVPTQIFEDPASQALYIASEYFYNLTDEESRGSDEEGYISRYGGCQKVTSSISLLAARDLHTNQNWKIDIQSAGSDTELDLFLKSRYGTGCSFGGTKPTAQPGTLEVNIQDDGKDISETACPINYITKVLYSPALGRVVAFDLGQACTFYKNIEESVDCLDFEMADTFTFESP